MEPVDLALVLAFDCSASVNLNEFVLMTTGTAAALRDEDVSAGLLNGPTGAVLVALLLWSGPGAQEVMVEWTRIASPTELAKFAQAVEDVPRVLPAGTTAIGEALVACTRLLAAQPADSRRQIIDFVGDGRSNAGIDPEPVRDILVAAGVTINGLCVLHEEADLVESYTREVIGGPGAFALQCQDYAGFADAMRQNLAREIAMSRAIKLGYAASGSSAPGWWEYPSAHNPRALPENRPACTPATHADDPPYRCSPSSRAAARATRNPPHGAKTHTPAHCRSHAASGRNRTS